MGLLTAEAILGVSDLKTRTVPVPEWGGEIVLGEMSGLDRDDWDAALEARRSAERIAAAKEKRPVNALAGGEMHSARMLAWTARRPEGGDMFAVRKPGGRIDAAATEAVVEKLARRSGAVLDRLLEVALALNGLGPKALDTAEGNSVGTPGDSPSGKPA